MHLLRCRVREADRPQKITGYQSNESDEWFCVTCWNMFTWEGTLHGRPRDRELRNKRFEELEGGQYVMILQNNTFGGDQGLVSVEMGDVFKADRIGTVTANGPSLERTMQWGTIDIMVGTERLRLFAEDFGTIKFLDLMSHIEDGEYEAAYTTPEGVDPGYWRPTLETRIQIQRAFGDDDLADKLIKQQHLQPKETTMLDTANVDINVAIKIKREANQTHYTVYSLSLIHI